MTHIPCFSITVTQAIDCTVSLLLQAVFCWMPLTFSQKQCSHWSSLVPVWCWHCWSLDTSACGGVLSSVQWCMCTTGYWVRIMSLGWEWLEQRCLWDGWAMFSTTQCYRRSLLCCYYLWLYAGHCGAGIQRTRKQEGKTRCTTWSIQYMNQSWQYREDRRNSLKQCML